jgi:hypothetical protein
VIGRQATEPTASDTMIELHAGNAPPQPSNTGAASHAWWSVPNPAMVPAVNDTAAAGSTTDGETR